MDVRASVQSALNAAARLVFSLQKYDSVTLLLQELHWLKVERRIEYKLAVLVYRCLHGTAPQYLANDFRRVADLGTRRRLCSASTPALVVSPSRLSTVGDRAFPVAAVNNQRPPTQRASAPRRQMDVRLRAPNSPIATQLIVSLHYVITRPHRMHRVKSATDVPRLCVSVSVEHKRFRFLTYDMINLSF